MVFLEESPIPGVLDIDSLDSNDNLKEERCLSILAAESGYVHVANC